MNGIVYHKPIPGHSCRQLFVGSIFRHTCRRYFWQPIGHTPKAGAR